MRNRIFGAIGVLFGAGLLLFNLLGSGQVQGKGAYGAGQTSGLVFAGLLFVAGMNYLLKSSGKSPE